MRLEPVTHCYLCGRPGRKLYRGLRDELYGATGTWSIDRCSCATCGLMWLNPRPIESDILEIYSNYYTHADEHDNSLARGRRFREAYIRGQRAYLAANLGYDVPRSDTSRIVRRIIECWPGRAADTEYLVFNQESRHGARLLDVGCGRGAAVLRLRALGWDAEGVDPDAEAVKAAISAGARVRMGTATNLPQSQPYDVVVLSHVLEHLHDPMEGLRAAKAVLKPAGRVVVVTSNVFSWLHARYGADWRGLDVPRHLYIFTIAQLGELLDRAGLRPLELHTSARGANSVVVGSRSIARRGANRRRWVATGDRLIAELLQQLEFMRLTRRPIDGEELVAIAQANE